MSLDVSGIFLDVNPILNSFLGKYDSLSLIGMTDEGAYEYLHKDITKGFYFKSSRQKYGEIEDTLRIVPETDEIGELLSKTVVFELKNFDGTFVRYTRTGEIPPRRPSFQWIFSVKPNKQDKRVIQ